MKVSVSKVKEYVTDIKLIDIDVASKEEAQLIDPDLSCNHRFLPKSLVKTGQFRGFFVIAVLTFTGSELPIGKTFSFPHNSQGWKVIKKNKAARHIRFKPDEYTEDEAKLKTMLREWAENNGIKFGE